MILGTIYELPNGGGRARVTDGPFRGRWEVVVMDTGRVIRVTGSVLRRWRRTYTPRKAVARG